MQQSNQKIRDPTRDSQTLTSKNKLALISFVFVNKVLSENSHVHVSVFHSCYLTTELSNWSQDPLTHKTQNIYFLALHRECLLIPGLDRCREKHTHE